MTDETPQEEFVDTDAAVQRVREFAEEFVPGTWRGVVGVQLIEDAIVVRYEMSEALSEIPYATEVHEPSGTLGSHTQAGEPRGWGTE